MTLYVGNSNVITLSGLTDEITEQVINNATVELTGIVDRNGTPVSGTEALAMAYVTGSSGVYRVVLEDTVPLVAGRRYQVVITADAGSGRIGLWRVPKTAEYRRAIP